jgi:hypothetical protein
MDYLIEYILEESFGYFVIMFIVGIIISCVWGAVTYSIQDNKGYSENGFWWGFFLGWIGLIVVLLKPNLNSVYTPSSYASSNTSSSVVPVGGWKCKCGRGNASYVSTCICGVSKRSIVFADDGAEKKKEVKAAPKQEAIPAAQSGENALLTEERKISALKEYKELLDSGILSQEEFDAKKKQLLGL